MTTLEFSFIAGHPNFTAISMDSSKLAVSLTETVIGKPSLEGFVFKLNGFIAEEQLPIDASEEAIAEAIMYLYSPKCPDEIGASIGRSRVY